MKHISGYMTISDQLYRQMLEDQLAEYRWSQRMDNDPEYAAEWLRQQELIDDRNDW